MPAIDPRLVIAFVWIAVCTTIMYWLLVHRQQALPSVRYVLLAAILVRMIPALVLPRGAAYEMNVFRQTAEVVRAGQSVYLTPLAYPYLPLQLYWFAAADWLANNVGLFFIFWLKSINILADVAIAGLLYLAVLRTSGERQALWSAWLYALNPVTIMVVSYQGQFDAIPLFLLVLAWYLFTFYGGTGKGITLSALALGLAILSKTWPVIFAPIALLRLPSWRMRSVYALVMSSVPLMGIMSYEARFPGSWPNIIRRALGAGAISGWWGYSAIANVFVEISGRGNQLFTRSSAVGKVVGMLAGLLTVWLTRKRSTQYSLLMTILALFATVPNLGLQGLSWVIPLALLAAKYNEFGFYVAGATIHMVVSYWGIHLSQGLYLLLPELWASVIIQLSSLTVWLVIVIWCVQEATQKRAFPQLVRQQNSSIQA